MRALVSRIRQGGNNAAQPAVQRDVLAAASRRQGRALT